MDRKKRFIVSRDSDYTGNRTCFFVHTGDDHVPGEGSVLAYLALEKAGVEGNELHIYPYGGHGYGMRKNGNQFLIGPLEQHCG